VSLALDLDALLATITTTASAISGIRTAFDYDAWPDSPPGMFNKNAALHLTGFPEEGGGVTYIMRGSGLSRYELEIPLYTVIIPAAQVKRSRSWAAPYFDRYRVAFDTRASILGVGTGNTGSLRYDGCRVVRAIPDWDAYMGFYMLRHLLIADIRGAVDRP
jgi:hypothetical protein